MAFRLYSLRPALPFLARFAPACLALAAWHAHAQSDPGQPFDSSFGVERLEERTPRGMVPPPARIETPATVGGDEQGYVGTPADERAAGAGAPSDAATIAAFRSAYARGGSPRMAIYFNRELSDEVREWIPGDHTRAEVTMKESVRAYGHASGAGHAGMSAESSASYTAETRSKRAVGMTGLRDDPRESWKWEFEDAITAAFLEANANVVDRAVIFRQTARQSPQSAGFEGNISTSLNEMSALQKYADVLVEMKVSRSPRSHFGYVFRATAKHVRTGRILGSAYIDGSDERARLVTYRYVASERGYTRRPVADGMGVNEVSRELAVKLMRSLTGQIRK